MVNLAYGRKNKSFQIKKEMFMNRTHTYMKNRVKLNWFVWAVCSAATAAAAAASAVVTVDRTFTLQKLLLSFQIFLAFYNVARFSSASSILRFISNSQSICFAIDFTI